MYKTAWSKTTAMLQVLLLCSLLLCGSRAEAQILDKPESVLLHVVDSFIAGGAQTDSKVHQEKVIMALERIGFLKRKKAIPALVKTYLYYTPQDFPTPVYVLPAMRVMNESVRKYIHRLSKSGKYRHLNRQDFPLGDLDYLREELKKVSKK